MKRLDRDLWFIQRQLWVQSLQSSKNPEIYTAMWWVVLGIISTACLLAY